MQKPPELFDREREWTDLVAFVEQPGPGTRLAIVRGRRRQGKSFLLRRLVEASGGFYHQALEQERPQALDAIGAALGEHLGTPGGRLAFADWDAAVGALTSLSNGDRPKVVVLDELPYLLAHSAELPSVLQRHLDASRDSGPPVRLVVCGSALSVMATLLGGSQALRGRATHDLRIDTFDYRAAAAFWGITDPATAFVVHAVIGGTPGYRDLLPSKVPAKPGDVNRWLEAGVLNPASAMFREDDYLLTEERSLTDRALYHAVVGAIAAGNTSQSAIAAALGRDARAVQHPLRALEEVGFVQRDDDVLRSRRPIYRLADPILRFHHVVKRGDLARFEDRRFADAWADAKPRYATHVLGPHFEHLAREFTFRYATPDTTGGAVARVGSAVVNDRAARAQHELDVVATTRLPNGSTTVIAIGEAKHTTRRRNLADLTRLESILDLLVARGDATNETKLLLFAANGFDRALQRTAAERTDTELVDLLRLYSGS